MHILCVIAEFSNGVLGFRLCGTLPYNERRGKEGRNGEEWGGKRKKGRTKEVRKEEGESGDEKEGEKQKRRRKEGGH